MLGRLYSSSSISTLFSDAHCHLRRMPDNVAGKIGELAIMNCTTNDTTRLYGNLIRTGRTPKTSEQTDISQQGQLSKLVSDYIAFIDSTNGNCNLNITIQASAEGTYECIDAATEKSVTAQLIVLGTSPFYSFKFCFQSSFKIFARLLSLSLLTQETCNGSEIDLEHGLLGALVGPPRLLLSIQKFVAICHS